MRKLRLVAVIVFGAYGGQALYKYLSEEGKTFVSRFKLPESETVKETETPVEIVESKSSMDEYFEAHKNEAQVTSMDEYYQTHRDEIKVEKVATKVKKTIEEKVEQHKVDSTVKKLDDISAETERIAKEIFGNEVVKKAVETEPKVEIKAVEIQPEPEKKVEIYKPVSKKGCCKNYRAKYCVKIDHSRDNESTNDIIMRHFQ